MDLINFLLKHSRRGLILSIFAGVVSGACNAGLIASINAAIKHGAIDRNRSLVFIALCFLLPLSRHLSERILNQIGQHSMYTLRMGLCRQILAAPLRIIEQLGPARLLAILTEDVPTITATVFMLPTVCINVAMIIACFIYLGVLSAYLLIALLAFLLLGVLGYHLFVSKARRLFTHARQEANNLHNHFRGLLYGIKELQLHESRRSEFLERVLQSTASSIESDNITGQNIYSAATSSGQMLLFGLIGVVVFLTPRFHYFPAMALTGYAFTLLYLMSPLQAIMNISPIITRANISLRTVTDLGLSLVKYECCESRVAADATSWHSLKLQSVVHTYFQEKDSRPFILGPIDLSFRPGEIVFITGGNGTGKTTFAKLLTGLYTPEEGTIFLDEHAVDDEGARRRYRQYFTAIFGDYFLFAELIGIAYNDALNSTASDYLEKLQLANCVKIRDRTLSTLDLSQGQRKRLALLTAYLEDRPIYLFDEWAADQDPYFKDIFYRELLPDLRARGKTVFVISHDERYYSTADRVIKLENGSVIQDATAELRGT